MTLGQLAAAIQDPPRTKDKGADGIEARPTPMRKAIRPRA
jgi:hypothetical protein